jgi:hypothetical protein
MAQKVIVEVQSDLSHESDAHSVPFGFEGADLEIDLTEAEHAEFKAAMQRYVDAARKVGRTSRAKSKPAVVSGGGSGLTKEQRAEVRAYSAQHGYALAERGRLPDVAIVAWREKNPAILEKMAG